MKIDLNKGDTILTGKWQNHKVEVRRTGKNEIGQPTVNGKPMLRFRIEKLMKKKRKKVLEHIESFGDFAMRLMPILILILFASCTVKNTEYYMKKGKDAIAAHDPDGAVKNLKKITNKYPDCIDAYMMMAQANTDRDSLDRAAENYTEVIKLTHSTSPEYMGNLYFLRGRTYYKNVKDSLACKDWNKACNDFGHLGACKQLRMLCK
jgi:hypothetical protein